jgi:hypothetical protein
MLWAFHKDQNKHVHKLRTYGKKTVKFKFCRNITELWSEYVPVCSFHQPGNHLLPNIITCIFLYCHFLCPKSLKMATWIYSHILTEPVTWDILLHCAAVASLSSIIEVSFIVFLQYHNVYFSCTYCEPFRVYCDSWWMNSSSHFTSSHVLHHIFIFP